MSPFYNKLEVAVLSLKFRAQLWLLWLRMDARGKRIANVTKVAVNPNCKLKGDFVSFLYGKCVLVISAWQYKNECMVWTITNNDSSQPHQKTWNKEVTMINGSWLLTEFSRKFFLAWSNNQGMLLCLSWALSSKQKIGPPIPAALENQLNPFIVPPTKSS